MIRDQNCPGISDSRIPSNEGWNEAFGHAHVTSTKSRQLRDISIPAKFKWRRPMGLHLGHDLFGDQADVVQVPHVEDLEIEPRGS